MRNHLFTTDPDGEAAPANGWVLEGTQRYVFASQQSDTVPLYRYVKPSSGDYWFSTAVNDQIALTREYVAEGPRFYLYPSQKPGTVAITRWFNGWDNHFYTTESGPADSGASNYHREDTLGYIYKDETSGTVALHRWLNEPSYELNGTTLKTWFYSKQTKQMKESLLSLDNCLKVGAYPVLLVVLGTISEVAPPNKSQIIL